MKPEPAMVLSDLELIAAEAAAQARKDAALLAELMAIDDDTPESTIPEEP